MTLSHALPQVVNLVKAQIVFNDIASTLPDADADADAGADADAEADNDADADAAIGIDSDAGAAPPDALVPALPALAPAPAGLAATPEGSSAAAPGALAAETPSVAVAPTTALGVVAAGVQAATEAPRATEAPSRRRRLRELGFRVMLRVLDALSALQDPRPPPHPARFLMEDEKIGQGSWPGLGS